MSTRKIKRPEALVPLAPHVFEILLSLSDGDRHGYVIIKDIEARSRGQIRLSTSTLYAAIRRLLTQGLVADVGDRPADVSGGPPRRYYRITDYGRDVARLEAERAQRVAREARRKFLLNER